jgi:hypothetical protein
MEIPVGEIQKKLRWDARELAGKCLRAFRQTFDRRSAGELTIMARVTYAAGVQEAFD